MSEVAEMVFFDEYAFFFSVVMLVGFLLVQVSLSGSLRRGMRHIFSEVRRIAILSQFKFIWLSRRANRRQQFLFSSLVATQSLNLIALRQHISIIIF